MTTIFDQILATFKSDLIGTVKVGTNIYRSRFEAASRAETPFIYIEPEESDQDNERTTAKLDWQGKIRISIGVRGQIPDEVADPILADVHSRILNSYLSGTLKNLLIDIQPIKHKWRFSEGDQPIAVVDIYFMVTYRTNITDLSTGVL